MAVYFNEAVTYPSAQSSRTETAGDGKVLLYESEKWKREKIHPLDVGK